MSWDDLSTEKKLVLGCFLFLFASFSIMAVFMENTVQVTKYGKDKYYLESSLPVELSATGAQSSTPKLKADVKGSIYENGSNMTVFGACFDGLGVLLPEASAKFTAWYPNGTVWIGPNATMDRIYRDVDHPTGNSTNLPNGTGRWKIHVTMGDNIGTYLTEIRCEYGGDWAIAFGEWQNPEWVKRIGDSQNTLNSLYNMTSVFKNDTQNNMSTLINMVNSLYLSVGGAGTNNSQQVSELSRSIGDLELARWTLDTTNPFFVIGSGTHNFEAVDMLSVDAIAAVADDGYFVEYDGDHVWAEYNVAGVSFKGVSVLPSNSIYAWGVGSSGGSPVVSINGANATIPTLPSGSPTAFNDVVLFQQPNNPSGMFWSYLLGDDGTIYKSVNGGSNWTVVSTIASGTRGRFSQVVENVGAGVQPNGYQVMAGQGNNVWIDDGVTQNTYTMPSGYNVTDVSLLYYNLGYAVGKSATDAAVFRYNGTGMEKVYTINDSSIVPTGIVVHTQSDIWVTTADPSTFYHYDGYRWGYSNIGSGSLVSVIISFGNTTGIGIRDVSMPDSRHGYAVGTDGMIVVYKQENIQKLDQISNFLDRMNASVEYKLDNILTNVTYTNLYMQTTLFPLMNGTYQNTLQILIDLGLLQSQVNQTIQLQNATLQIVNSTDQKVDLLVNRSNKIRAWVTQ